MLVIGFLQWWYGPGWRDAARQVLSRIKHTYLYFSIPTLLGTLFLPWRRIMSSSEGSLEQRMRAMGDNAVSRLVGFAIRTMMLFVGALAIALTFVLGSLMVLVWPLLPPLGVGLIVGGSWL